MTSQAVLFAVIEKAVAEARIALDNADSAHCVYWLTIVQLRTAELAVTMMPKIRTKS